jgi:hypothetical protein
MIRRAASVPSVKVWGNPANQGRSAETKGLIDRRSPNEILSEMQFPHWLMVAGAVLVGIGFIGLVVRNHPMPFI